MKQAFWHFIGRMLAESGMWMSLVVHARKHPYIHIKDSNGDPYMDRFWLLKERSWFPWAIRLHHIQREDRDRHLHDHPYDYRTIILCNGYLEQTLDGSIFEYGPGDTVARRAEHFHKILAVRGNVWTMFIYRHRNKSNPWGFLVPIEGDEVRKIHWKVYLKDNPPADASYGDRRN